jgi:hypothetical protein
MLRNPSEWDFPMEIVRFSNDGSVIQFGLKEFLKRKVCLVRKKKLKIHLKI